MKILHKEEFLRKKYSCTKKTYDYIIEQGSKLKEDYTNEVIFHCYWSGQLNKFHLLSIMSCYYFNVRNYKNRKIILWTDDKVEENEYYTKIKKFADVKKWDINQFKSDFKMNIFTSYVNKHDQSFYSDLVRYCILYCYGGFYFDLDVLFLKNCSPLLSNFSDNVCVYAWQPFKRIGPPPLKPHPYPNGAIFFTMKKRHPELKKMIKYIIEKNKGWGFQEAYLTYDLPIDFLVLPCYWFNPQWMGCNPDITFNKNQSWLNPFLETHKLYNFDNFYKGAFAYHWFSTLEHTYQENCIMDQFYDFFKNELM
jgi:hypothetical protein